VKDRTTDTILNVKAVHAKPRNRNFLCVCLHRRRFTSVADGLMFYSWFIYFVKLSLSSCSSDRRETLPHDRYLTEFYTVSTKNCNPVYVAITLANNIGF